MASVKVLKEVELFTAVGSTYARIFAGKTAIESKIKRLLPSFSLNCAFFVFFIVEIRIL
jgi:hypothetical protein